MVFRFFRQGVNVTIEARNEGDALARLAAIELDHANAMALRANHCEARRRYAIDRRVIRVNALASGRVAASWPVDVQDCLGMAMTGAAIGTGKDEAKAIGDLLRRTFKERGINVDLFA